MGREVGHRVFTYAIGLGGERHSWSAGVDSLLSIVELGYKAGKRTTHGTHTTGVEEKHHKNFEKFWGQTSSQYKADLKGHMEAPQCPCLTPPGG